MKSIIQFNISKGEQYYVAEGIGIPVVTQAKTLDKLTENIREAVELHFEGEDSAELGFGKESSVLLNFELPRIAHA